MSTKNQPLAARMRPRTLDDIIGQDDIIGPGSPLRRLADPTNNNPSGSIILYGNPGTGKTSIAHAVANTTQAHVAQLSATTTGVKDLRLEISAARVRKADRDEPTILFIDEIHRFSKSQQDILLPAVEDGTVTLIGATTENPSFSLNSALMSRSILCRLNPISEENIATAITNACNDPRGYNATVTIDDDALRLLSSNAGGDIRTALTHCESAVGVALSQHTAKEGKIIRVTVEHVTASASNVAALYDRDGDQHYDIISAFIKSMRGSDPDAAVYWLARMIAAGEDPRFIARRLIVHASEDVGMADPTVLPTCIAAAQAVQLVGLPEARINLTQATLAIATAPKSNSVIHAINTANLAVDAAPNAEVPNHLRDAHYPGAKALGHGEGYLYPHSFPGHVTDTSVQYLPDRLRGSTIYRPSNNGAEVEVAQRLNSIRTHQEKNN